MPSLILPAANNDSNGAIGSNVSWLTIEDSAFLDDMSKDIFHDMATKLWRSIQKYGSRAQISSFLHFTFILDLGTKLVYRFHRLFPSRHYLCMWLPTQYCMYHWCEGSNNSTDGSAHEHASLYLTAVMEVPVTGSVQGMSAGSLCLQPSVLFQRHMGDKWGQCPWHMLARWPPCLYSARSDHQLWLGDEELGDALVCQHQQMPRAPNLEGPLLSPTPPPPPPLKPTVSVCRCSPCLALKCFAFLEHVFI